MGEIVVPITDDYSAFDLILNLVNNKEFNYENDLFVNEYDL